MSRHQIDFTAQDILSAIGFEAQRISFAVSQHAAGYPFPDPATMKVSIDKMSYLNDTLLKFKDMLSATETSMGATSGMKAELSN